jgi:acetoin utilization deacetylase AcuC-like enzyme
MPKYRLLRDRLLRQQILHEDEMRVPERASDDDLLRAHDADYIERVRAGTLSAKEIRRIGLPWSPMLWERSRYVSGATIAAGRAALQDGVGFNLGGGTHHAFRDHGEGYCVFNDSVVAARAWQAAGLVRRVVVLDCDVHQGNGTAAIAADDPTIFTFSIHGARNFPYHKVPSNLDIDLEDGTGDDEYLLMLEGGLERALALSHADMAIYLAGADPYIGDRLGRLALTMEGLAARDRLVLERCRAAQLPVVVTMAGGYARQVEDIAAIHTRTIQIATDLYRRPGV